MPTDLLTPADLAPFATIEEDKAAAMIEDAIAMAGLVAPCLTGTTQQLTDQQMAAAKAVLRAAVLRWNDSGSGVVQSQTMGPFGATIDTRHPRRNMFWPSEIESLQTICKGGDELAAFAIDTATDVPMSAHPTFGGWSGWSSWPGGWNDNGTYLPFSGTM